jgi:hypothetical protein
MAGLDVYDSACALAKKEDFLANAIRTPGQVLDLVPMSAVVRRPPRPDAAPPGKIEVTAAGKLGFRGNLAFRRRLELLCFASLKTTAFRRRIAVSHDG